MTRSMAVLYGLSPTEELPWRPFPSRDEAVPPLSPEEIAERLRFARGDENILARLKKDIEERIGEIEKNLSSVKVWKEELAVLRRMLESMPKRVANP